MKIIYLQIILIILILIIEIKNDLPIHCIQEQVEGDWIFNLDISKTTENLLKNTCGHPTPGEEFETQQCSNKYIEILMKKEKIQLKVKLLKNGELLIKESENKQVIEYIKKYESYKESYWTMMYDRGLEIVINKGIKLFSYFKYQKRKGQKDYENKCSETLTGHFSLLKQQKDIKFELDNFVLGCFYGYKLSQPLVQTRQSLVYQIVLANQTVDYQLIDKMIKNNAKQLNFDQLIKNNNQIRLKYHNKQQFLKNYVLFLNHYSQIYNKSLTFQFNDRKINEQYQKIIKTNNIINQNNNKRFKLKSQKINTQLNKTLNYQFKYTQTNEQHQFNQELKEQLKKQNLKENYSIEEEFLSDFREQGNECGSCYSISFMHMLQTQLNKKYNLKADKKITLSIQQILDCSYYDQGCQGGTPQLIGKFGQELYILEENIKEYQKKQSGKCYSFESLQIKRVVKVDEYGWINKIYDSSNRNIMRIMKSIIEYGGVVACIYTHEAFIYYQSGVFDLQNDFKEQQHWRPIDHAVFIYGWGFD